MNKGSKPAADVEKPMVFSVAESAGVVIAHAMITGSATVLDAEGQPQIIISIPTKDLPSLVD